MVKEAIDCYLNSKDPNNFIEVIFTAEADNLYEKLLVYLFMARE